MLALYVKKIQYQINDYHSVFHGNLTTLGKKLSKMLVTLVNHYKLFRHLQQECLNQSEPAYQ